MKYYEMHELVYQKLKSQKFMSWDKSTSYEEMFSHSTNTFLKQSLHRQNLDFKNLNVLDLGTGTGTSALFAAHEGANVMGVEVSQTAIDIAKDHAQTLKLKIDFLTQDVLSFNHDRKFDLAIDSTLLHCLVGEHDRQKFYECVRRHLVPGGLLFVNTMISGQDKSLFDPTYFHFENHVLWSLGMSEIADRKLINGKSYFPHRTLLTEEMQKEEFKRFGFEAIDLKVNKKESGCIIGLLRIIN